jgi:hypothetical protein
MGMGIGIGIGIDYAQTLQDAVIFLTPRRRRYMIRSSMLKTVNGLKQGRFSLRDKDVISDFHFSAIALIDNFSDPW